MTFIDFFAGIGGFRLGLEMAGHECVGHCEIDKFANKSYMAMHDVKKGEWYADDVRGVSPESLPEADMWCGGFPCQAFSVAGKRRGFEDMRGTLIFEIFRLAAERKPKIILLENVGGLLTHEQGRTFATILMGFWELGYDVEWEVLNSKRWVPQNRERIFIIGYLGGGCGRKVFPIGNGNGKISEFSGPVANTLTTRTTANTVGTYIVENQQSSQEIKQIGNIDQHKRKRENPQTGRVYSVDGISPCLSTMQGGGSKPKILTPKRTEYGKTIRKDYEGGKITESRHNMTRLEPREDGISNTITTVQKDNLLVIPTPSGIYTGVSDNFRRPPLKGLSRTLKANQHDAGVVIGQRIRRLTPLECFRLQGFPDELFYKAKAVNSDSQLYKQAGNSVTVNVIHEIGKRLKMLEEMRWKD